MKKTFSLNHLRQSSQRKELYWSACFPPHNGLSIRHTKTGEMSFSIVLQSQLSLRARNCQYCYVTSEVLAAIFIFEQKETHDEMETAAFVYFILRKKVQLQHPIYHFFGELSEINERFSIERYLTK
ncbi:hypothetical protein CEXT_71931 [Caerostris extrusa]|uniref:Uncharacterized protein n=1 Tax=Caerostris extrusa TaxID=172846 RepID=A0AAV4Q8N6_CAEEX|nr:hypothetical protein CEXT_71931 [Caerostris extrusa]